MRWTVRWAVRWVVVVRGCRGVVRGWCGGWAHHRDTDMCAISIRGGDAAATGPTPITARVWSGVLQKPCKTTKG